MNNNSTESEEVLSRTNDYDIIAEETFKGMMEQAELVSASNNINFGGRGSNIRTMYLSTFGRKN